MTFLILAFVKAALILAVAVGLSILMRRRSAASRHLVWGIALLASAIVPFVPAATTISVPETYAPAQNILWSPSSPEAGVSATAPLTADVPPIPSSTDTVSPLTWIAGAWAVGVVIVGFSTLAGFFQAKRLLRQSQPLTASSDIGAVPVRVSCEIDVPVALSMPQDAIVLPPDWEDWPAERLRHVLLHEAAHLRRRDAYWMLVGRLACAIHWFNPIAWYANDRMRHEAELAADDAVLTAGARPTQYAEDLIAFARRNSVPALGLPLSRPTGLNLRIRRIVREGVNRRAVNGRRVAATASMGVLAAASFASMRFVAQVEPEGVMALVSQRVTEAMTASGTRVEFVCATDGNRVWGPDAKPAKLPGVLGSKLKKLRPGQVVLVFARDVRKGAVPWTIETQVDEIKGATPGSMSQFLERRANKPTDRLYNAMVVKLKQEVGVIDVTFQTEDGAMKVLADEKVTNGKSDGPLNLHPLPLTSQTIGYDPKGPRNFAEMLAPKIPAGRWVSLELYDRSGKPAMLRLSSRSGRQWIINSYTPVANITRIVVKSRTMSEIRFSALPVEPALH